MALSDSSSKEFHLDLDVERFYCGEQGVKLTPHAFAFLRYFVLQPMCRSSCSRCKIGAPCAGIAPHLSLIVA